MSDFNDIKYKIGADYVGGPAMKRANDDLKKLKDQAGGAGKEAGKSAKEMNRFGEGAESAAYGAKELLGSIAGPQFSFFADMVHKSTEQLNRMKEASSKNTAAMTGLKLAMGAALVYGGVRIAAWALGWDEANKNLKEQIELAKKLNEEAQKFADLRRDIADYKIGLIDDPKKQIQALKRQKEIEENELDGLYLQKTMDRVKHDSVSLALEYGMLGTLSELTGSRSNASEWYLRLTGQFEALDLTIKNIEKKENIITDYQNQIDKLELLEKKRIDTTKRQEQIKKEETFLESYRNELRALNDELNKASPADVLARQFNALGGITSERENELRLLHKTIEATKMEIAARDAATNAAQRSKDAAKSAMESLNLQLIGLKKGPEAAFRAQLRMHGVDEESIKTIQRYQDEIKKLNDDKDKLNKSRIRPTGTNAAVESRIMTRGYNTTSPEQQTADNTKKSAEEIKKLKGAIDSMKVTLERVFFYSDFVSVRDN